MALRAGDPCALVCSAALPLRNLQLASERGAMGNLARQRWASGQELAAAPKQSDTRIESVREETAGRDVQLLSPGGKAATAPPAPLAAPPPLKSQLVTIFSRCRIQRLVCSLANTVLTLLLTIPIGVLTHAERTEVGPAVCHQTAPSTGKYCEHWHCFFFLPLLPSHGLQAVLCGES